MKFSVEPIPAIDLLDSRCVRLMQGDYDQVTTYHRDPVAMARHWWSQGASLLHVVDLDAAKSGGTSNNWALIAAITQTVGIPVQTGGGIRTMEDVERVFKLGIHRVVLGTAAVQSPKLVSDAVGHFGTERVAVGIDARQDEVCIQGWTASSGLDILTFAKDMETCGVRRIIYTDIGRDGTMQGPNLNAYRTLGTALKQARITASGGVASFEDLLALQDLAPLGVDSVIIGRALYEGKFEDQTLWDTPTQV